MLWLKALHVVFVVTWFAGLFYLPRLFVYHAAASDSLGVERFILMERRLFVIMSIGALLAAILGLAMILASPGYLREPWLQVKLLLVALLGGYHLWCYRILAALALRRDVHSPRWFRWFNEVPSLLLLAIVILAVVKPALRLA
jgi:protoporphyrinogen IX oxidase